MQRGLGSIDSGWAAGFQQDANMAAGEHGFLLQVLGTHFDALGFHLLSHLCCSLERNLIPNKPVFGFVLLESQKEFLVACKDLQ